MLYLVEGFDGHSQERAKEKHKEALEVLKDEPNRKEKLVNAFKKRMSDLEITETEYPVVI
jgi:hypothetical protein